MPKKRKRSSPTHEAPTAGEPRAGIAEPTGISPSGQIYTLKALALENGFCQFEEWLKGIKDRETKQRIQSRLDRIERGNLGDSGAVGEGVSEFRLMFGAGYRIYYACIDKTLVVLLVGGDKSTQSKDITLARDLWKDHKNDAQRYERDVRR